MIDVSAILSKTGASLTESTCNIKLLISVYSLSETLIETLINPLKSKIGVIVNILSTTSTIAFPSTEAAKDKTSLSTSKADIV